MTSDTGILVTGHPCLAAKIGRGFDELAESAWVSPGPLRSPEQAVAVVTDAAERLGGLDAVVHAHAGDPPRRGPLIETDESEWDRGAEAPIREALFVIQAAYKRFAGATGAIVLVVPSIALTGAAGLVPFAAAAEGVRQLAKSAARAWGREGVRVNVMTLPLNDWHVLGAPSQRVPSRYGASLPGPNAADEIARAARFLCSIDSGALTGGTLGLDRGTVLAP